MQIIDKDITTIKSGIIAHQVNCTNHIGSGVAKALIQKWPRVKTEYHNWCDRFGTDNILGHVQLLVIDSSLYVANNFSQKDKGYDGKLYTNYDAVRKCFESINTMNKTLYRTQVYIPFNYGCGLGGGSWGTIEQIIDDVCPGVIACRI